MAPCRVWCLLVLVVLQVVILHGGRGRGSIDHARIRTVARLLKEDFLAEVWNWLASRAAWVRLLACFALVALYLSKNRLLSYRLGCVVVHSLPCDLGHVLLRETRILRRIQGVWSEGRRVVMRCMVHAVVTAVNGCRWVDQIETSAIVRQSCIQMEINVIRVGRRLLLRRLDRTRVRLVLCVKGEAHGLYGQLWLIQIQGRGLIHLEAGVVPVAGCRILPRLQIRWRVGSYPVTLPCNWDLVVL